MGHTTVAPAFHVEYHKRKVDDSLEARMDRKELTAWDSPARQCVLVLCHLVNTGLAVEKTSRYQSEASPQPAARKHAIDHVHHTNPGYYHIP